MCVVSGTFRTRFSMRWRTLPNGWFERRHVGTHTALEAAQRMCKAQTPVDLVREYQEWVGGAFQRVMADGVACQQFVGAFVGPLSGKQASRSSLKRRRPSIPKQRDLAQHVALETSQGGSTVRANENPARRDCITLLGSAPTGQSARTICPGISAKTPLRST